MEEIKRGTYYRNPLYIDCFLGLVLHYALVSSFFFFKKCPLPLSPKTDPLSPSLSVPSFLSHLMRDMSHPSRHDRSRRD